MKFFSHLLSASSLALFFVLGSCSSASDSLYPVSTESNSLVSLSLDTDLVVEDEELARAVYQVDASSGRPLSHVLPEKNVLVRLAVRRGSSGTPLVQDELLLFQKVAGQNKYRFKGDIKIPDGSGTLQVSAFIVRESSGSSDDRVFLTESGGKLSTIETSRLLVADADGRVSIDNVVYMADWQSLSTSVVSGKTVYKLSSMRFRPSGTLLRMNFANGGGLSKLRGGLKVSTNAFFYQWSYDFTSLTGGNLMHGHTSDVSKHERVFDLPSGLSQGDNVASRSIYLWVMPNKATSNLATSIQAWVVHGGYYHAGRGWVAGPRPIWNYPPSKKGDPIIYESEENPNYQSLFYSVSNPRLGSRRISLNISERDCYFFEDSNDPNYYYGWACVA